VKKRGLKREKGGGRERARRLVRVEGEE